MLTDFRLFELMLYSLVNFLPYLILVLYPFTDKLRFSKRKTVFLVLLLTVFQIWCGVWLVVSPSTEASILSALCTAGYMAFYFLAVKDQPGKLLFVLLIVSNFANLIVIAAKFFEGVFFPEYARQSNRLSYSVMSILLQGLLMPFLFWCFKKYLKNSAFLEMTMKVWRYLWLIPLTFYLCWYNSLYFNDRSSLEQALLPQSTLISFLINLGAMVVYFMVVKLIRQTEENLILQQVNNQLTIQNIRYDSLQERMEETRRARHDMRQHMSVIAALAEEKQYDKLLEYIETYRNTYQGARQVLYCSHMALNALISYYAQLSEERGIRYETELSVPREFSVSDADLTVLFGNLLENASDGCMTMPEEKRFVRIQITIEKETTMVFCIANSCGGEIKKKNGHFLSTKHDGYGIGIESARNIAERYNGVLQIEEGNGQFTVSGMLCP